MGLFNKNKYDICPKVQELKSLVTRYSLNIKLNGKLLVPNGFYFVLGKRGKVLDVFDEGEHFFSFSTLPYCCRKFNIDKVKDKDIFKFDGYFVSKSLTAGKFKTYRKVIMGTRAYGMFKVGVIGIYSYKINQIKEFMQSLLNEFDFIKTGEAEKIVESWTNELSVKSLEKNNFILDDLIKNIPQIAESLKNDFSRLFATAGLEICDLSIYKYILPKEYQQQSDQFLKQIKQNSDMSFQSTDNITINSNIEHDLNKIENNTQDSITESKDIKSLLSENDLTEAQNLVDSLGSNKEKYNTLYQTRTNNLIQNTSLKTNENNHNQIDTQSEEISNLQNQSYDENKGQYVPFGNFEINQGIIDQESLQNVKNAKPKQKFVDLD